MDKKKWSTGLKIAAFAFAILTLLMFAEEAMYGSVSGIGTIYFSTFEFAFQRGTCFEMGAHYNAIYIVSFVLVLIAIVSIGTIFVTKLIGKSNVQLNKWLLIAAAGSLLCVAVFAFFAKVVLLGELCVQGVPLEEAKEGLKEVVLSKGAIGQGVFGLLGAGSLAATLFIEK